jgi:hypothetical protein
MLNLMDQFEQFCRSKPTDETYEYQQPTVCACAQFAEFIGMGDKYLGLTDEKKLICPDPDYIFVEAEVYAATLPHTFGALADRIKERIHDQPGGIFNRVCEEV